MLDNSLQGLEDPFEVYDIWYRPFWHNKVFLVVSAVVFCLLVALVVFLEYRKWRAKAEEVPYCESVLTRLKDIRYSPGGHKDLRLGYQEVVELLKGYMEVCLFLSVKSKTDSELVTVVSELELCDEVKRDLVTVLSHAGEARFSEGSGSESEYMADLGKSIAFVEITSETMAKEA